MPEEAQGPLSKGWLRPGVTQIGSTLEPGNGTEEGCRAIKATWQLDAGNADKQAAVCLTVLIRVSRNLRKRYSWSHFGRF